MFRTKKRIIFLRSTDVNEISTSEVPYFVIETPQKLNDCFWETDDFKLVKIKTSMWFMTVEMSTLPVEVSIAHNLNVKETQRWIFASNFI